jgi:hypothetical protein
MEKQANRARRLLSLSRLEEQWVLQSQSLLPQRCEDAMNRLSNLSAPRTSNLVERPFRLSVSRAVRAAATPRAGVTSRFLTVLLRALSVAAA